MTLLLLAFAASVHTDFEAGNIGRSEWISPSHLRIGVRGETDQNNRNRQPSWFYFRIDGVRGQDLTIDLADLFGEYNFRKHNGSGLRTMQPMYSYDDRSWTHFDKTEWIEAQSTVRLRLKPERDRVWIARQAPYTTAHLEALLREVRQHKHVREETVGKTVEGRPMRLLTVTNPSIPDKGKKVIWLMARQHSWESGTSWVAEGALRYLLSGEGEKIRDGCIFKIFPMADPDGVVRGGVRFNKHGYDLNRNWDTVDPKLMPEIHAQRSAILKWVDAGNRVDLFLSLHNTESVDYIQGPLTAGGPEIKQLGQRFWKLLDETTPFYSPKGPRDAAATTTPGMKGRMTVYQGLFHDRKIPAFLMELMVDANPKLGRPPTVKDRVEFGAALVKIMAEAVGFSL
jgi:murein tripeptide amidase MpaA